MTIEVEVRDYLRSCEPLMALLNNEPARINMDWQGNINASHVTLYRAGGSLHDYLPVHSPALALHCYGSTRPAAADLSDSVAWHLRAITQADDPLRSATVESVVWLPTTEGAARYVVTTVVTAQLAPTG